MKMPSNIHLPPGSAMEIENGPPLFQAVEGAFAADAVFSYKPLDEALDEAVERELRVEWTCRYIVNWSLNLIGQIKQPEIPGGVVNLPKAAILQWNANWELDDRATAPSGAPVGFGSFASIGDIKVIERIIHAGPAAGPIVMLAIHESGYRAMSGTGGHKDARFDFRFAELPAPLGQKPKLEGIDGGKKKG